MFTCMCMQATKTQDGGGFGAINVKVSQVLESIKLIKENQLYETLTLKFELRLVFLRYWRKTITVLRDRVNLD